MIPLKTPSHSRASPQPPAPPRIAFYISGHGFGHVCRSMPIVSALLQRGATVYLCCPHAPTLFPDYADLFVGGSVEPRFCYRQIPTHSYDGIIQSDAVTVDVQRTKTEKLDTLFTKEYHEWLERERVWLESAKVQLLVADATFVAGPLSHQLRIPSVLVTNFLWDSIYEGVFGGLETEQHWQPIVQKVTECYQKYTRWFRQPGWIPSPAFSEHASSIVDVPAVFRVPRTTDRNAILRVLCDSHPEWPNETYQQLQQSRLLLVTFGGHPQLQSSTRHIQLSPGWMALLLNGREAPTDTMLSVNGRHASIYLPDLNLVSDAVLGKLGYGTCGECIGAHHTPMIYVRRRGFVEEQGLLTWMKTENRGGLVELSEDHFRQGLWSSAMLEIPSKQHFKTEPCAAVSGQDVIADRLLACLL